MPGLNGMEAATALRKKDSSVLLVFVTNMAQYAVRGYDVNAAGFILKPVSYYDFLMRMRKCIGILQTRVEEYVTLNMRQGIIRLPARDILYVEVNRHMLTYHTLRTLFRPPVPWRKRKRLFGGPAFFAATAAIL